MRDLGLFPRGVFGRHSDLTLPLDAQRWSGAAQLSSVSRHISGSGFRVGTGGKFLGGVGGYRHHPEHGLGLGEVDRVPRHVITLLARSGAATAALPAASRPTRSRRNRNPGCRIPSSAAACPIPARVDPGRGARPGRRGRARSDGGSCSTRRSAGRRPQRAAERRRGGVGDRRRGGAVTAFYVLPRRS